jgi:hypothetical protein
MTHARSISRCLSTGKHPRGSGPQTQGYQQQLDVAELLNKIVASMTHPSPQAVRDVDENQAEREGKRNAQVLAAYDEKVRKHGESPLQKSDMVVDSLQVHTYSGPVCFVTACTPNSASWVRRLRLCARSSRAKFPTGLSTGGCIRYRCGAIMVQPMAISRR